MKVKFVINCTPSAFAVKFTLKTLAFPDFSAIVPVPALGLIQVSIEKLVPRLNVLDTRLLAGKATLDLLNSAPMDVMLTSYDSTKVLLPLTAWLSCPL
jgi:hypothetical protein